MPAAAMPVEDNVGSYQHGIGNPDRSILSARAPSSGHVPSTGPATSPEGLDGLAAHRANGTPCGLERPVHRMRPCVRLVSGAYARRPFDDDGGRAGMCLLARPAHPILARATKSRHVSWRDHGLVQCMPGQFPTVLAQGPSGLPEALGLRGLARPLSAVSCLFRLDVFARGRDFASRHQESGRSLQRARGTPRCPIPKTAELAGQRSCIGLRHRPTRGGQTAALPTLIPGHLCVVKLGCEQ